MRARLILSLCLSTFALFACDAERGAVSPSLSPVSAGSLPPPAGPSQPTAREEGEIDSTISPESRSSLSEGARTALEACGLLESLDLVAGLGRLPRGADAPKYANIWGDPPYLEGRS